MHMNDVFELVSFALIISDIDPAATNITVTQNWVLNGVVAVLMLCVAYFLVKEFGKTDQVRLDLKEFAERITSSIEKLNESIGDLALTVKDLEKWSLEQFVKRTEFDRSVKELREGLNGFSKRVMEEINTIRKDYK